MIIQVKREKGAIRLNHDFASAVPEFAALLEDSLLGAPALAYVAFVTDLAEDNIWAGLPEPIRKKEVADSLKLDNSVAKNDKVQAALKKYKLFCEQNVSYQFKEAHNSGMKLVSDYVKQTKELNTDSAKEFAEVLNKMPALLKGKQEIEKINTKDSARGAARGGRTLTLNEQG